MTDRFPPLPAEIARHGPWRALEPLAGDASMRRYARLSGCRSRSAIAVVYPRGSAGLLARDLEVRSWLEDRGLRVPRLLASATADGWALLEDFGSDDAARSLAAVNAEERARSVERLIGPLEVLARLPPESLPPWSPPLDRARLRWELAGFELWYLRDRRGVPLSGAVVGWLDDLAERCAAGPRRVCHRDYHLNNLYLLADGAVGVIDFQDVLLGPEPYDVVSLVGERDALRLLSADQQVDMTSFWAQRTAASEEWEPLAASVRAQRGLKVLGTFARLERSGRTTYGEWLRALETPIGELISGLGAPQELSVLLLHSTRQGGPYVR